MLRIAWFGKQTFKQNYQRQVCVHVRGLEGLGGRALYDQTHQAQVLDSGSTSMFGKCFLWSFWGREKAASPTCSCTSWTPLCCTCHSRWSECLWKDVLYLLSGWGGAPSGPQASFSPDHVLLWGSSSAVSAPTSGSAHVSRLQCFQIKDNVEHGDGCLPDNNILTGAGLQILLLIESSQFM